MVRLAVLLALSATTAEGRAVETSTAVHHVQLENGLEVFIEVDRRSPQAGLAVAIDAGSADDPLGRLGLAHLTEHLAFRRTAHLGDLEIFERVERAGGRLNAYTAPDRTVYWAEGPASHLEEWLWIEAERLGSARPTEDDVKVEKKIVDRELSDRDGLFRRMWDIEHRALYPAGHRYHPRANERGQVRRMTPEDVEWFFAAHYAPDRATLAVVSPFEVERVEAWVRRHFGALPARGASPPEVQPPARSCPDAKIVVRSFLRNPRFHSRWSVGPELGADAFEVAVEYGRSRLRQALREADLHPKTWAHVEPIRTGFEIVLGARLPADERGADLDGLAAEAITALIEEEVDPAKIDAAKEKIRWRRIRGWRSPVERAQWLARMQQLGVRPDGWAQRLRAVEPGDVAQALAALEASTRVDTYHRYEKGAKKEDIDGERVCGE